MSINLKMESLKKINQCDENGKRHGPWKELFPNGKLSYECNFKHGKMHGVAVSYYKSGSLMEEACYKNGIKDGYTKIYKENGIPNSAYHYKNGIKHGGFIKNADYGGLIFTGVMNKGRFYHQKAYNMQLKNFPTGDIKTKFKDENLWYETVFIK